MPWLKAGDNAATHPIVMRAGVGDPRAVNEVFGFATRCALHSAAHTTDYFIDEAVTYMFGMTETERLVKAAIKAGYFKRARKDGHPGYLLVDDPDFLHIRLRAEIEWERQQKADSANPALTVPVRLRDGDACRYCGVVVFWRARKGARRGTYDHRIPGQAATIDTLVVACGGCNAGRRDNPEADSRYPLKPEPREPYYSEQTAAFLADHNIRVTPRNARPGDQPDPVHRDRAPSATPRPAPPRDDATAPASADQMPTESGSAGSGRATGRVMPAPQATPRPRSRRARRGRPRTGQPPRPRETPPP